MSVVRITFLVLLVLAAVWRWWEQAEPTLFGFARLYSL